VTRLVIYRICTDEAMELMMKQASKQQQLLVAS
jgi:hypothetical protein